MSADEDTELRDLVAQTLESNGVLGKIRAQLRASVFLALEEQESLQNKAPFLNQDLKKFLSTKEGRAVTGLVREFLEFFNLEFTLAVFEPESGFGQQDETRQSLARELNMPDDGAPKAPLLAELLRQSNGDRKSMAGRHTDTNDHSVGDMHSSIPKDLTSKQVSDARKKFDYYDKDKNGEIDKDELRDLFIDIFPSFNRNMLDRYVNDEFRAADKDFSSSISFTEFLGMYKRLFLLCRTVVSGDVEEIVTPHSLSKSSSQNFSSVESKNQRNLERNHPSSQNGPKQLTQESNTDTEEDPFFDDPMPPTAGIKNYGRDLLSPTDSKASRPSQIPVYSALRSESDRGKDKTTANGTVGVKSPTKGASSGLSSLQGLPSLTGDKGGGRKSPSHDSENLRAMDKRMAELGLDGGTPEYEYEDDFASSGHSISQKSPRTRSEARSQNGSIAEEIEEDLEDYSIEGDDMLRSEKSGFDDITTDHTISQHDAGFDYVEDLQSP